MIVGPDGRGGIFGSTNAGSLYPQLFHLDASGDTTAGWSYGGIDLTPGVTRSQHTSIAPRAILPDGDGGTFELTAEQAPYDGSGGFWYPKQFYLHRRSDRGTVADGWPAEGVLLETQYLNPRFEGLHFPRMALDGAGGVLIAWLGWADLPDWPNPRVVAQRVTAAGARLWGDDGVTVRLGRGAATIPALVGDGHGGALVFWAQRDSSETSLRIRGQHVLASGDVGWDTDGKVVSSDTYDRIVDAIPADGGWVWADYHTAIAAAGDGDSGAIIGWAGAHGVDLNIVAARVAADGNLPWGHDVRVCSAPGEQSTLDCAADRAGGAIFAWRDGREGSDIGIYAQAVRRDGRLRWRPDGVAVSLGTGERGPVLVADDGLDGTYFAWGDPVAGGRVFAQRLTPSGRPAPGWVGNGTVVSRVAEPDYNHEVGLSLVGGQRGNAIVAWNDFRRGSFAMLLTPLGPAGAAEVVHKRGATPSDAGPVPASQPAFGIRGMQPNPMTAGGTVRLALLGLAPATLEIFDTAGRRVWTREITSGPGEYSVRLADGALLPAGVYLVRLSQGTQVTAARAVYLR
ncbi:MAG TPA: T9SS type A sorting domain-containing protein [Candidatus Saccharimonadaceae bacterium]|jgi:hypothetical protein|nr:T9SS type A sorting domain-containing protein [Candidatus Saccharimonadaceae bacterium]